MKLRATVNADGSVGTIEILDSSASNMGFEQAALDAVSQWQFEPARKGDSAVNSSTEIHLRFNPPTRGSRGFVASGFGMASGSSPGSMSAALPTRTASVNMGETSALQSRDRAAWLPVEYVRYRTYGRPPGQIGAIYDRNLLIPPGTGGGKVLPN